MTNEESKEEIVARKKALRKEIKRRLAEITSDRVDVAESFYRNLMSVEAFRNARVVGLYVDFRNEAPTRPFLPKLFNNADAKIETVAVPYCVGPEMRFYKLRRPERNPETNEPIFTDLEEFPPFGILEPKSELRDDPRNGVAPQEIDALVTPGLGFDPEGRRLGRGAGYYDKYVPLLRSDVKLIGICFDEQVVDEVPVDALDRRVDVVVTPTRVIYPNARTEGKPR